MRSGLQSSSSTIILSRRCALLGYVGGVGLHFCLTSVARYVLYADPVASRAASDGPDVDGMCCNGLWHLCSKQSDAGYELKLNVEMLLLVDA